MKALAAEMVRTFGKRLEPLGISVRELTGDMQMTKTEILTTQVNTADAFLLSKNLFYTYIDVREDCATDVTRNKHRAAITDCVTE